MTTRHNQLGWIFAAVITGAAGIYLMADGAYRYYQAHNATVEPCPIGVPARCIRAREMAEREPR